MDYIQYTFTTNAEKAEILIALLAEHPFDTFQEIETGLDAFIPAPQHTEEVHAAVMALSTQFDAPFQQIEKPAENWNAVWESNFHPIQVDDFCGIRAEFHDPIQGVEHELVIQPKMAFGTGHHATTYLVMKLMRSIDFQDKAVFDYGCGTGILALLASRLGAKDIDAIDIDEWAYENTLENAQMNAVPNINAAQGTLDTFKTGNYDIILANITFNVISTSIPRLAAMLPKGGQLITSGFFQEDIAALLAIAEANGLKLVEQLQRENWACLLLQK